MYNKYSIAKQILAGATASTFFKSKGFLVTNTGTAPQIYTIHMMTGVTGATAGVTMTSPYGAPQQSQIFQLEIVGFTFSPENSAFTAYTLF